MPPFLGGLASVSVYITNYLGWERKQFRFPRSKKRRIRRKWARDPRNWRNVQHPQGYMMGDRFICNQPFFDKFVSTTATTSFVGGAR